MLTSITCKRSYVLTSGKHLIDWFSIARYDHSNTKPITKQLHYSANFKETVNQNTQLKTALSSAIDQFRYIKELPTFYPLIFWVYRKEFHERTKTPFTVYKYTHKKFEKSVKYANEMNDDVIHSTQYHIQKYINRVVTLGRAKNVARK